MAERTEDDILFEEVDDELRQDQANKLWQVYGQYVLALCVAIVIGVGGFKGWQHYDLTTRQEAGERFAAAMTLVASSDRPRTPAWNRLFVIFINSFVLKCSA